MLYALTWFAVFSLLGLWSLAAWLLHAIGSWTAAQAAGAAQAGTALPDGGLPVWLAAWLPPQAQEALASLAAAVVPLIDATVGFLPALAGALSVVIASVWALGALLLLGLGALLHGLVHALRKRAAAATPMHAGSAA